MIPENVTTSFEKTLLQAAIPLLSTLVFKSTILLLMVSDLIHALTLGMDCHTSTMINVMYVGWTYLFFWAKYFNRNNRGWEATNIKVVVSYVELSKAAAPYGPNHFSSIINGNE